MIRLPINCKKYDGLDFAASHVRTAAQLEGPFNTASAFLWGKLLEGDSWKIIECKEIENTNMI
jgi:hypothetical protein